MKSAKLSSRLRRRVLAREHNYKLFPDPNASARERLHPTEKVILILMRDRLLGQFLAIIGIR